MNSRLAAVVMGLISGWVVSADLQRPTFSTRVDLVRVDVSVTRGRQPVRDLKAADFEVFSVQAREGYYAEK